MPERDPLRSQGDLVIDVEPGDGGPWSFKSYRTQTPFTVTNSGDFVVRTGETERFRITNSGSITGLSGISGLTDWLNVKNPAYGAKGDGVTDDTTAIFNALTAAAASGGTVYLPEGTYITQGHFFTGNGISVIGAGQGATTVRLKSGLSANNVFTTNGMSDCLFANMTIDCNRQNYVGSSGAEAINITLGQRNTVRNIRITNALQNGIVVAGAPYTLIDGCVIDNASPVLGRKDIWVGKSGSTHSTGTIVSNCSMLSSGITIGDSDDVTVRGCTATCSVATDGPLYVGQGVHRIRVEGNYLYGSGNHGIDFDFSNTDSTYGCVIVGNTCYNNTNSGIGVASNGAVVVGNNCYNNGQNSGTTPYGIMVDGAGIVVSGNTCTDVQVSKTQTFGIGIRNVSGVTGTLTIAGNNLNGNLTGPITGSTTGTEHQIANNVGSATILPGTRDDVLRKGQAISGEPFPRTAGDASTQLVGGTIFLTAVGLMKGDVVTNVLTHITSGGTSTSLSKVGIYDKNGNLLAKSADQGSNWNFVGDFVNPLSAPFTITSTDLYYLAAVTNGTATCSMWATTNRDLQGFGSGKRAFATGGTGQTDLPATVTLSGSGVVCYWLGWS